VTLAKGNEKIAIIGVENWGRGARWPKYGNLKRAAKGTETYPVKLLLSHDPSHWDAVVRKNHPDIDITFSGHTHGFQFGIEIPGIKWSPSQYLYPQWAGLYTKGTQHIYVNRGFGFLGYPGRVGIKPEITVIELKKA
jgi:predicted MPP superfamily phosphohydrolase